MKYGIIKNALSQELCDEMVDLMDSMIYHSRVNDKNTSNDYYGLFNLIQLKLQPQLESAFKFELLPTYNFSRIYNTNSKLNPHIDRPACECSVTINLKNEKGTWPIWVQESANSDPEFFDLYPGDLVWYKGIEVRHWRNPNTGGKVYQSFFHYVQKYGNFKDFAYDENKEAWKEDLNNPLYYIEI